MRSFECTHLRIGLKFDVSQSPKFNFGKKVELPFSTCTWLLPWILETMLLHSGVARIFRWGGGGQDFKKGTCINSKQVILACRECSGAYVVIIIYWGGGSGGSPSENFFLKCFKMAHFHGSSIIMLLLGAYIWALGQSGVNTLKVLLQ